VQVKFDVFVKGDQVHVYPYIEFEKKLLFIKYKQRYDLLESDNIDSNYMYMPADVIEKITNNRNDILKINALNIEFLNIELDLYRFWHSNKNSLSTTIRADIPIETNVKQISKDIKKIKKYITKWFNKQLDRLHKRYQDELEKEDYIKKFEDALKKAIKE